MKSSQNNCPICGESWDDHDFGVPHPFCPKEPLPGKSWYPYPKKKNLFVKLKERFLKLIKNT